MSEKSSKIKKLATLVAIGLVAVTAGTLVNNSLQKNTDKTNQESKTKSSEEKQVIKQEKADVSNMAEEAASQTAQQAAEKQASQDAQVAANNGQAQEAVASAGSGSGQTYVDAGGGAAAQGGAVQGGSVQSGGQPAAPAVGGGTPQWPNNIDPSTYMYDDADGAALNAALDDPNNYITMPDGRRLYRGPGNAGVVPFYNGP